MHPIEPVKALVEMACGKYVSSSSTYILHVNDPLVNFSGLILFLGEMRGISHSREGQQWRNVLHDDAGSEKVFLSQVQLSRNEQV